MYTSDEESEVDDEESRSSGGSDSRSEDSDSDDENRDDDSNGENNPQAGENSLDGGSMKNDSDEESAPETPRSENSDSLQNTLDTPTIGEPSTVVEDPDADADADGDGTGSDLEQSTELDPDALPPPPTDGELLDEDDASSTHSHEVIESQIPDSFNPEMRSPIFFGYTTETLDEVNSFSKEKAAAKLETEAGTVERKIDQKKEDLAQYKIDCEARSLARGKKVEHLKKVQNAAKVQREGEYIAMEKTMPPDQYAQLKRQFQMDEEAAAKAAGAEMGEVRRRVCVIPMSLQ